MTAKEIMEYINSHTYHQCSFEEAIYHASGAGIDVIEIAIYSCVRDDFINRPKRFYRYIRHI